MSDNNNLDQVIRDANIGADTDDVEEMAAEVIALAEMELEAWHA